MTLGRVGRGLVASQPERHVSLVMPTRSGKTRGIVVPAILEWAGPVIATSVKADLLWDPSYGSGTLARREQLGEVWIFDPTAQSGYPCVPWSPLGRCETWTGALRTARTMLGASGRARGGADDNSAYFASRAESSLAPLFRAAAELGAGMDLCLAWARAGQRCVDDLAEALQDAEPEALASVDGLMSGSDRGNADVWATVLTLLKPWEDPAVCKATAEPLWSPADLLNGTANTLYVISGTDASRLAPLYAALLDEILDAVKAKAMRDGPLSPRLLLALDEIANIAPISDLPQLLSILGGMGATVLTAWQSAAQMSAGYGPEGASTILGNSAAQLWSATDDPDSISRVTQILGSREVTQTSVSSDAQAGLFGRKKRSISESTGRIPTIDASQLRTMSEPLLLVSGMPPTPVKLRFHDRDRTLRKLSGLQPSTLPSEPVAVTAPDDEDDDLPTPEPIAPEPERTLPPEPVWDIDWTPAPEPEPAPEPATPVPTWNLDWSERPEPVDLNAGF